MTAPATAGLIERLSLRLCDACYHKRIPDGGWCYMFRKEPAGAYCGQFKVDPASKHALKEPPCEK